MPAQEKTPAPIAPADPTAAKPPQANSPQAKPPAALEEPRAGGNYLRDPLTGALTINPAHTTSEE